MPDNYHHLDTPDRGPQETYFVHFCSTHDCLFFGIILYSEVYKTPLPPQTVPPVIKCAWCDQYTFSRAATEAEITDLNNGLVWECLTCGYIIPRSYDPRGTEPPKCPKCGSNNWRATNVAVLFKENKVRSPAEHP